MTNKGWNMETWFLLLLLLPFPLGIGTLSHEEIHSAHGQRGAEMCSNNQLDPRSIHMLIGHQLEINVHGHVHGQDGHVYGQDGHTQDHHVLGSSLDTETQPDTEEYYYIENHENPHTHRVLDVSDEGEVIMANEIPTRLSTLSQQWRNESGILINKQSGLALHVQQQSCCNLTLTKTTTEGLSTWIFYKDNFIVNIETDRQARLLETHGLSVSLTFDHPMGTTNQKWSVRPVTCDKRMGPKLMAAHRPTKCPELFEKKDDEKEFQKFDYHPDYPECWENIKPKFKLFTKTKSKNCTIADAKNELFDLKSCSALDELKAMEGLRKIVFITHGFLGKSETGEWPELMADLIIDYDKDVAVVTVDWREGAALDWTGLFYPQPAANTRYVGIATARIVDQLRKLKPKARFHCIGHSLGAHICGFVGKETTIDRISGMDPAGPLFKRTTKGEERLDSTDATVVDALHTDGNILGFGLMKPLGHIDFYAGKDEDHYGSEQKGCDNYILPSNIPGKGSVCDHSRSHEIYRATIAEGPTVAEGSYTPEVECKIYKDATLTECQVLNKQPRIGYWYQGGFTGLYGFKEKDQP